MATQATNKIYWENIAIGRDRAQTFSANVKRFFLELKNALSKKFYYISYSRLVAVQLSFNRMRAQKVRADKLNQNEFKQPSENLHLHLSNLLVFSPFYRKFKQ